MLWSSSMTELLYGSLFGTSLRRTDVLPRSFCTPWGKNKRGAELSKPGENLPGFPGSFENQEELWVIINRGLQERSLCIAHIFEVLTKWPGAQPLIYELMTERKNQRRNEYGYQGLRTPAGTTPGSTPNPEQSTHDYPPGANCLIFNVRPPTNRGCLAFFKGTKMAVCAGRAEEKDVLKSPSGLSQKRHQTLTVNT